MDTDLDQPLIEPTSAERQKVYERLLERQEIRAASQLPKLDIPKLYRRQLCILRVQKFNDALEPYIHAELARIKDPPKGFGARILATVQCYRAARQALYNATGITDPRTREPDFAALADKRFPDGPTFGNQTQ